MIKISKERALEARQIGIAKAFFDLGYSPEAIKLAFEQEGIYKEAIWGELLGWAAKQLPRVGKYFSGMVRPAVEGMTTAPGKTLWQGAKNALSLKPGTIGGTVGQGTLLHDLFQGAPPRITPQFYA